MSIRIGSKLLFMYEDGRGVKRDVTAILTSDILSENVISDEEVFDRFNRLVKNQLAINPSLSKQFIVAARFLLKKVPDATDIFIEEVEESTSSGNSGGDGSGVAILLALAVIIGLICFPLLVMLGMRGKFLLKGVYKQCKGDEYTAFVKNYTYIGIGFYALVALLVILDSILNLGVGGPAIIVLIFGGIVYFVVSLVMVKKKFLPEGESFAILDDLKKKVKSPVTVTKNDTKK